MVVFQFIALRSLFLQHALTREPSPTGMFPCVLAERMCAAADKVSVAFSRVRQ
jgi:hypothetical protein